MQKRQLGGGGPQVSALGLGCMSLAGAFGATTEAEGLACLDAALDAGIDFFDTANVYGMGLSETVLGTWLRSRKPDVVVATKAGIVRGGPVDNSHEHLKGELVASLKRLGRDHVELFYAHRRNPSMPPEDLAGSMARLIEAGLIGGYGLSEVAPSTLRRAHAVHPVRAVQNEYSLWSRLPELGLIRTCADLGVAFVPFSPLARGMFGEVSVHPDSFAADDFRRPMPRFSTENYPVNHAAIDGFRLFAQARGWKVARLALSWLLSRGQHLIPIPGTRTAAHLGEWADADRIVLSAEDLAEIDRLLPPGFAHGDRYPDTLAATVERYC